MISGLFKKVYGRALVILKATAQIIFCSTLFDRKFELRAPNY